MLWLLLRQIWWWWWGDSLVETWEVFGGEWGVDFLGVVNLSRYWVPFVSRRIHNVMRRNFLQAKKNKNEVFMSPHYQWNGPSMGSYLLLLFFPFFFFEEQKKNSSNYAFQSIRPRPFPGGIVSIILIQIQPAHCSTTTGNLPLVLLFLIQWLLILRFSSLRSLSSSWLQA